MDNIDKIKDLEKKINQLKELNLEKNENFDKSKIELIKLKEEIEKEINNINDTKQESLKTKLIELKKEIDNVDVDDGRKIAYDDMLKDIDEAIKFYSKLPFGKYVVWILNKAKNE